MADTKKPVPGDVVRFLRQTIRPFSLQVPESTVTTSQVIIPPTREEEQDARDAVWATPPPDRRFQKMTFGMGWEACSRFWRSRLGLEEPKP